MQIVAVIKHQKNKERITIIAKTTTMDMSYFYYQSCDEQNQDICNGNWKLDIIVYYCRKNPDDKAVV
jgi:hypothetical protein